MSTLKKPVFWLVFWDTILTLSAIAIGTALYYQYVVHEPPCPLCIYARIPPLLAVLLATLILLLAIRNLKLKQNGTGLHRIGGILLACIGGAETYVGHLLITAEQGFSCGGPMEMPHWFLLDRLLPALFKPEADCGMSPVLWQGFTMAQAVFYFGLFLTASGLLAILLSRGEHGSESISNH